MSKRSQNPVIDESAISPNEGKQKLEMMREQGQALLNKRPVKKASYDVWTDRTKYHIQKIFGSDTPHAATFGSYTGCYSVGGSDEDEGEEQSRFEHLNAEVEVLESLIATLEIDCKTGIKKRPKNQKFDFWPLLHPEVRKVSRKRYEDEHYADAVEAALKQFNTRVKIIVQEKTGRELDGASLMQHAFSPGNPVIMLDDLSNETGKNIQQGYMQIFTGAMIGIRNPKAHNNLVIDSKRAAHFLFLASLFFHKLDESS